MTKENAVELLISKGYDAKLIDGVVEIETPDIKDADRMNRILKKAGYNASAGWRMKHD